VFIDEKERFYKVKEYLMSYEESKDLIRAYMFKKKGVIAFVHFKKGYDFGSYSGNFFKELYGYIRKNKLPKISEIIIGFEYK